MTEAGKEIVKRFKEMKKFTLAGNREYWTEIYYKDGKIEIAGGDTMANSEEYRLDITETEALEKIKTYFYYHSLKFNKKIELVTDEQVLEYWKLWPHEG